MRSKMLAGILVLVTTVCALVRFGMRDRGGPIVYYTPPPTPDQVLPAARPQPLVVDLHPTTADDFPQFLGPHRDAAVTHVQLSRDWASRPPELVWRQEIGAGWSAFSVVNGFAVTMEQRGDDELTTCYEVRTGRLAWSHAFPSRFQVMGIGPRSTPTIHDGFVYVLSPTGHLFALDGADGSRVWERNLLVEFGISEDQENETIRFGRANSLLVVDELLIVPAGGPPGQRVSLAAFDRTTGRRVWAAGTRNVSFSSPCLATLAGVRQVLIVNEDTVSGHAVATGQVLWEIPWPGDSNTSANVAQAVPLPPARFFLSKGYGRGAAVFELAATNDGSMTVHRVWQSAKVLRTKFTNVVVRDGFVYGLSEGILECVDLETGERRWQGGRYGHGQILRVSDLLLVLSDTGELVLVELSPEGQVVHGRIQALTGQTWNNIALYGSYLLLRNAREAACYKLALRAR